MNLLRSTLAAATLALASFAASAALVTHDFSGTILGGSLDGEQFTGSFSYDNSPPADDTGFDGEDLFALESFSLEFLGLTFDLSDLGTQYAAEMGGGFIGLEAEGATFVFVPGILGAPFFAWNDGRQSGDGTVDYALRVPEPATLGLALMAGGLLASRRRVAA